MRAIVEFVRRDGDLPLLRMYVHGAPHRRQHIQIIHQYRDVLYRAATDAKISVPINEKVALWVLFIDPCSPDFDNLLVALFRAMDGSCNAKPTLLKDDKLVEVIEKVGRFYPSG